MKEMEEDRGEWKSASKEERRVTREQLFVQVSSVNGKNGLA